MNANNYGRLASMVLILLMTHGPSGAQTLQADVFADVSGLPSWEYTLINDEPLNSDNWITGFYLPIGAPVTDITSPPTWQVDTDGQSFILWSNVEPLPYPNDVAPGTTLSGFGFRSLGIQGTGQFQVEAWDHIADAPGPNASGTVMVPSGAAAVPESGFVATLAAIVIPLAIRIRHKRR